VNVCLIMIFAEAFAVVREAARRKLGMRHFDVQVSLLFLYTHYVFIQFKYRIELITLRISMIDYWWSSPS
jgi:hypothetical protein